MNSGTLAVSNRESRTVGSFSGESAPHGLFHAVNPCNECLYRHSFGARPSVRFEPKPDVIQQLLRIITCGKFGLCRNPCLAPNAWLPCNGSGKPVSGAAAEGADRVGQEVQQTLHVKRRPAEFQSKWQCLERGAKLTGAFESTVDSAGRRQGNIQRITRIFGQHQPVAGLVRLVCAQPVLGSRDRQ